MFSSIRHFSHSSFRRFPRISQNVVFPTQTFRERLAASKPVKQFRTGIRQPSVRNQILFTLGVSSALYLYAAKETNKEAYVWMMVREKGKALFGLQPMNADLRTMSKVKLVQEAQAAYDKLMSYVQSWPPRLKHHVSWLFVQIAQPILDANEGKRVAWALVGLSSATWLLWKWPRAVPFMRRSFTHDPLSGKSYTLLTSIFSHQSFIHLACNSLALSACGTTVYFYLAQSSERDMWRGQLPEASSGLHVLAFFVTAGLVSSLISHSANALWVFPRLIKTSTAVSSASRTAAALTADLKAATQKAAGAIKPSIGISGAVYAGMVLTALAYPQAVANIVFLPIFPIPIRWAVGACVAFDVVGLIRGFQVFDHYAHLGGAAFGAVYYLYGKDFWDTLRVAMMVFDGLIKPEKKEEPKS